MLTEPNLDFYRRRAKELLKLARGGDRDAQARFAQHHPDLNESNVEREILALNQAQLVISREAGFSSWPRLKAYVGAMERSRNESAEDRFQAIIRARDLEALAGCCEREPDAMAFRIAPLGFTPLHVAASIGWEEGARFLIEAGADIDAVSDRLGMTPLRTAIGYGKSAVGLILLDAGADPHIVDSEQNTNMQTAAYAGDTEMIRALIRHGVAADIFGAVALDDETRVRGICRQDPRALEQRMCSFQNVTIPPLHLGAYRDLPRMIDLLIELGADTNKADERGRTAIDLALHGGKRRAYERLVAHGCEPQRDLLAMVGTVERAERIARLHAALINGDMMCVIQELDADPSLVNQHFPDVWGTGGTFGATPLHWAAMAGHVDVARLLLERGASPASRDLTYDARPIGWAKEYRRREMAAFLEAHEAKRS